VLLAGVTLSPGLCILERDHDPDFCTFHRALNWRRMDSRDQVKKNVLLVMSGLIEHDRFKPESIMR
jgi:hypothetical protein